MPTLEQVFKPFARRFAFALVLVFLAKISLPDAHAQTNYWWDSNDSTAGFGTAQGTWAAPTTNNSTQGWTTDNAGTTTMSGSTTTANDNINFGTSSAQLGTGTITVSGNVSARVINFTASSSNITLSGGNISLGTSSAITVTNSANTSAITQAISSNITLGASPAWTVNNGGTVGTATLSVSGNVLGGSYGLTKSGNGTLILSGAANSWNGSTNVSAGTMTLSGSLATIGVINVNDSVLNITGNLTQTISGGPRTLNLSQYANQNSTINVSGSGIFNAGNGMLMGEESATGARSFINQSGGTINANGSVFMAGQNSTISVSGGTFNLGSSSLIMGVGTSVSTNSTLSVNGTGTVAMGYLELGKWSRNATGLTVNLGDGTVGGNLSITNMSYGAGAGSGATTINFNGGTLTTNGTFSMATQAATVVKSGGAIFNVVGATTFTVSNNLTTDGTGGGLTKNGTGTLTLSGAKSYTGGTTINAGTLSITAGAISSNITINSGGTLLLANHNMLSGGGNMTINSGTLNLSIYAQGAGPSVANFNDATITGGGGFLRGVSTYNFTGNTTWSNSAMDLLTAPTLNVISGTTTLASAFNISNGNANVTKSGNGTLVLSAANTYTSATILNAGTLNLTGNLSGGTAITTSGSSVFTQGSASVISGTSSFTHNSTGTSTLAGSNTYNGTTTINAGTLSVTGTTSSSAITINSGGNLTGTGTVGAVTLNTGGTIGAGAGASTVGKLTGASLTIGAGTGYAFTIGSAAGMTAGTDFDQIALSGALTLNNTSASKFTVSLYGAATGWSGAGTYTWDIITAGSLTGFTAGNFTTDFTNFGIAAGLRTGNWSFSNPSAGNIRLTYTGVGAGNATWSGGTGNWDAGFSPAVGEGSNLTFNGTAGGTSTNNISSGTLGAVGNITFSSGAGAYTLAANAGSAGVNAATALSVTGDIINNSSNTQTINTALGIASVRTVNTASGNIAIGGAVTGIGGLTKSGANTLTLSGNNTYTGATTVNAGTLNLTGSLNGTLTTASGGTFVAGSGARVASANFTVGTANASNALMVTNQITLGGGFTANISGGSSFTAQGANLASSATSRTLTLSGGTVTLGGGTAASYNITLTNPSFETDAGVANTYQARAITGWTASGTATYIEQGSSRIFAPAAPLSYNATTNLKWAAFQGAGNFSQVFNVANDGFYIVDFEAAARGSVYGPLDLKAQLDGVDVTAQLIPSQSTWTAYTGTSFYLTAGNHTINFMAINRALGDKSSTLDNVRISGTEAISDTATSIAVTASSGLSLGNSSVSRSIGGLSLLAGGSTTALTLSNGAGLVLNGDSSNNAISATGTSGQTSSIIPGSSAPSLIIATGKNISVDSGVNLTIQSVIAGPSVVSKIGAGTLTLSGANTYTGATTISAGTLNLTGNLTGGTAITIDGTGVFTQGAASVISGSSSLTHNSTATSTLAGVNSYTGATTINAGTLNLTGNLSGGTAITINGTGVFTQGAASVISGTSSLTKNTADTTTLSGANTYNGTTTVNAGTLAIGATQTLGTITGSGNLSLGSGFTLTSNSASSTTFSGVVSGSGNLAKAGTGTFTLNGSNTYTGTTTLSAGTLQMANANSLGSGGNITFGGGTLQYGTGLNTDISSRLKNSASAILIDTNSNNVTFASNLGSTNSGGLTKTGTGTLILGTDNTYSGTTTVNAGTLQLSGNISTSALTVATGGILSIGNTTTMAKYNASSITLQGGSGYAFTIGNVSSSVAGTDYDQLTATGALTLSNTAASPFTVYLNGTPTGWSNVGTYSWNIISAASVTGFNSGNFALNTSQFGIASANRTGTWSFSNAGGNITLNYTLATPDYIWDGGSGNWTDSYSAGVRGFSPANPTANDNLYFSGSGGGTVTNTMANSTISSVNFITFNSTAGAYTLNATTGAAGVSGGTPLTVTGDIINNSASNQAISMALAFGGSSSGVINTAAGNITISGVISGSGALIKEGNRTLTLSAANSYTGGTTINNGTIKIGSANVLGGNITINSGATLDGSGYHGPVTSSTNLIINGGTVIGGHSQQLSSVSMTNGSLQGSGANNNYFIGNGLTLSGNNTITAGIDIRTVAAGTFNVTSGTTIVSGTIDNVHGSSNPLTKNGTGTLTLSGNNFMRGTTLNAGTLNINSATALGNGTFAFTINGGTIDNTSGSAKTLTNNNTQNWNGDFAFLGTNGSLNMGTGAVTMNASRTVTVSNGTLTLGGAIGGSTFGLTKNGSGTLILTGASTYNGTTTVNAGNLTIGAADRIADTSNLNVAGGTFNLGGFNETLGSITGSGNITLGAGNLTTNSTSNSTFSGLISGTGGLTKNGSSTLTLSGNNTYNGTTTINAGTIEIAAAGRLGGGNYSANISNSGVLIYSGTNNQILGGVISGSGALTKAGSGTLTLSNNNTYTGATTINAGTLEITSTALLSGGNYTGSITNNGSLLLALNSNQTLSGVISGIGALTKNGTGTLTLAGNNNYSGGTTLNTGTLVIGNANAAGTGTITQTSGSSLLKIDTTGTITNDMSVYNVLASQSATLSGAITVNNATWDIDTGDTLTISGAVSGNGGVTKNGGGRLTLNGTNTYNGSTIVNSGTLEAASAGALGNNATVQVTGGSLLVSADNALNNKSLTLNSTSIAGLAFSGNYSGRVNNLTLSQNSIIDLGDGSVSIMFDTFVMNSYTLDIYNWTGTTLWGGGTGNDTDKVYFGDDLSDAALAKIYFHSGAVGGGDSFLGSGFELMPQTTFDGGLGYQIIPVPEPENYATGLLLLLGGAWWMWKRKPNTCQRALAGQPAEGSPKGETSGSERGNA
jgi:autotransporter-associated beta strand protein